MKSSIIIVSVFILAAFSIVFLGNPARKIIKRIPFESKIDRSIPATTVEWQDTLKNLEKVLEGTKINVEFPFKNTGNKILIITDVAPSCGCTIAEKPSKPIMPGETSSIKAVFNSENRTGTNHKELKVLLNTERRIQNLVFNVEVMPNNQ